MHKLSSCYYLRQVTLPLLHFNLKSSTFPSKSHFLYYPINLSANPNSNLNMSTRPSAFDALMSGARAAAAAKKKSQSSSSPKKRKVSDPEPAPNSESKSSDETQLQSANVKNGVEENVCDVVGNAKKFCVDSTSSVERVAKLKSDISKLKRKAGEFDPKLVVCWDDGEKIPFVFLSLAFDLIANETGRIVITDIVCNMLRTVMYTTPDDLVPVVYLSANRIAPAHEGLELGIGDASIIKALAEACGRTEAQVKKQYKELGDLGLVAKASRSSQSMMRKPDPLTVAKVFDTFRLIAKESGKDSQEKKKNRIKSLLVAATDCEPQYLIRLLQAKLRIGLAEQTLLAALGQAAVYKEKHSTPPNIQSRLDEAVKIVKQVYSVLPVYDKIVPALLNDGVWNLPKTCSFTPGVPVGPMLAKPTKGVSEIVQKFLDTEYTCEYKYDGERAQIHYLENGSVEIYSRNAEKNTGKFPDVVAAVSRLKKPCVESFVLDCELVAYDREKRKILPFQCLYDSFEEEAGYFQFATAITSNDIEEIQKFLDAAVDGSCEGLIIKTMSRDSTYEPSKRSFNWLKLKKDYMERGLVGFGSDCCVPWQRKAYW